MKKTIAAIPPIMCIIIALIITKKQPKEKVLYEGLASIKKAPVLVYHGPSERAKLAWKLLHKNWPVFIIEQSQGWVKITDAYNTTGWIKKHNIGKPKVLFLKDTQLKQLNNQNAHIMILCNTSATFVKQEKDTIIVEIEGCLYKAPKNQVWFCIS